MAIAQMAKVIIVSHRTQASELLETLQREGICQILNAQQAAVSKAWPELAAEARRPKDIEELLTRLAKSINFLKNYAEPKKGLASVLAPRDVIDENSYNNVVSDKDIIKIVDHAEQVEAAIEAAKSESENLTAALETLRPWTSLDIPLEELGQLKKTTCLTGLVPAQQFEKLQSDITQFDAAIGEAGQIDNKCACLIVCLNEKVTEVQKLLRSAEFEQVNFESMTGTIAQLIEQHSENLNKVTEQLQTECEKATSLAENLLKLQILHDHYENLLNREQTKGTAPVTEHTVLLEAWVKRDNLHTLEKIVSQFGASSINRIEPAEDEDIPVDIENNRVIKPFEVITRLYGMPQRIEVDPTAFLAPFFALFFALCLTDAGYGLTIIALMIFFIKKLQGDKKLMWMLGICSVVTLITGALTGGWFGDAVQQFMPALKPLREKMMLFDPFEKPMIFFGLSLALGYFQILTGLTIAFIHNLIRKNYIAALCDQLTWLVMLNSIVIFAAGKAGVLPAQIGKLFGTIVLIPAGMILLFSHREGPIFGRIGMGMYNLFSTIFYVGDVLSYLRLMALGMVTAGLAMAINVIAGIASDIPYGIGIIAMILVLVGGHGFNLAISGRSAFVHTLRLQYVEFFPKFFAGGGRAFEPLE